MNILGLGCYCSLKYVLKVGPKLTEHNYEQYLRYLSTYNKKFFDCSVHTDFINVRNFTKIVKGTKKETYF